jgi:SsrA-binding protein
MFMVRLSMPNYAENRKARFNYEILERYVAGIELLGTEVKSVRAGQMSLEGAFVIVRGGEAFLINASIPPYQPKNAPKDYDPLKNRKLLLTKKELAELAGSEKNKSLTIVPISVYNKNRKIKVEIALVKGKKKFDKRETLKKRDTDREIRREIKER